MAAFTPTSPATHPPEHLTRAVERVTFHSEETGFCLLRVKVRGTVMRNARATQRLTNLAARLRRGERSGSKL